jgi:hypothetical protein
MAQSLHLSHQNFYFENLGTKMKTMKSYLGTFAAVSLLLVTGAVSAAPIKGDIVFLGTWEAKAADGTTDAPVATAAHIAFSNVFVGGAIGDFAGATDATYTNFTFDPFVGPIVPLWTVQVGGVTFSFNLENVTTGMQTSTQLTLTGIGTIIAAGFSDTVFNWTFSGDGTPGGLFTFSASAFNVSEPSVVGLLGLGLIAMGAVGMRRRVIALKASIRA